MDWDMDLQCRIEHQFCEGLDPNLTLIFWNRYIINAYPETVQHEWLIVSQGDPRRLSHTFYVGIPIKKIGSQDIMTSWHHDMGLFRAWGFCKVCANVGKWCSSDCFWTNHHAIYQSTNLRCRWLVVIDCSTVQPFFPQGINVFLEVWTYPWCKIDRSKPFGVHGLTMKGQRGFSWIFQPATFKETCK